MALRCSLSLPSPSLFPASLDQPVREVFVPVICTGEDVCFSQRITELRDTSLLLVSASESFRAISRSLSKREVAVSSLSPARARVCDTAKMASSQDPRE